jgi:8-oxo-dGTP pyrophosphatase MutT (NUDIX family)
MGTPVIIKYAALMLDSKGRLLIVKSKKKDSWMSLGGKPDGHETPEECLLREVQEEIAMELTSARPYVETPIETAVGTEGLTVKIFFYLITAKGELMLNPEDNINEFRWISKEDFMNIKEGKSISIASGLELYAIPKLIEDGLMK